MTQPIAVAILPLDDRPPNYDFPALLAEAGDVAAKLPPKSWLGNPWRSGDIARLSEWLGDVAPTVDALIVALDTLGYGGLVNARRTPDSVDVVLERLSPLKRRGPTAGAGALQRAANLGSRRNHPHRQNRHQQRILTLASAFRGRFCG